jgi:hypothetical protein
LSFPIADFAAKKLIGSVEYNVEIVSEGTSELIVDWRKLAFKRAALVTPTGGLKSLGASFSVEHEVFGNALHIHLPVDQRTKVLFTTSPYETPPS